MKKIIISIALLLSTAAQAMEQGAENRRLFNGFYDNIKVHMVTKSSETFQEYDNMFLGIDAKGMNLNKKNEREAVNPSKPHTFSEPVGLLGLLFSRVKITQEKFNPELFKDCFKDTDIDKLTTLSPDNLKFIAATVRKTNTIEKTTYKFTNPIRDAAKIAVGLAAAGLTLYHYFKRQ